MPEGGRVGWLNSSVNCRGNGKGTPTWTGEGTTPVTKAAALPSERVERRECTWTHRGREKKKKRKKEKKKKTPYE